jgi:serine/threonine protein kinase/tetratricopeptide (TPR) repeat protein
MTREQWCRIESIFDRLADAEPDQRPKLLSHYSQSEHDSQVLDEVKKLLAHLEKNSLLDAGIPGLPQFRETEMVAGDVLANRFEIIRMVGRGGMGEVYEARDRELKDSVALKTLRMDWARDDQMVARFFQEVQLARKVTHVNVCRIFDLGTSTDSAGGRVVFLTMELVEGSTLAAWLNRAAQTLAVNLHVLRQVLLALRAAHQAQVLHCDLKPGNVLITATKDGEERAVVTDFGLSRMVPGCETGETLLSSKGFGTPLYMAPEQIEGHRSTIQSDIYSLGLLMYETVTGFLPFANEPGVALLKRMSRVPPEPRRFAPELARSWNNAILRCLAPDPSRRFSSVDELIDAVKEGNPRRIRIVTVDRRTWLAAAAAVFATGLGMTWKLGWFARPWYAPAGTKLMLTPITYPAEEPQLAGITSMLAAQLEQSAHINTVDPNSVPELLRMVQQQPGQAMNPETVRHVSLRMRIPLVLFGAITHLGSEYVLDIAVEQLSDSTLKPQRSWPFSIRSRNRAELMDAVGECARWIRRQAGESPAMVLSMDRKPEEATSGSWEAVQKLTLAEQSKASGDRNLAVAYLKQAILSDPEFALAHMRLGDILFNLNRYQEGIAHWRRANELASSGKLTRREQLRIRGLYNSELERFAEAQSCFAEYSSTFPHDDLGPFYLAYALRMQMRVAESIEQLWEAERRRPESYYTSVNRAICYLIANNRTELNREVSRLRDSGHDGSAALYAGVQSAIAGNPAAAENLFRSMLLSKDSQASGWGVTRLAYLWSETNRFGEAMALLQKDAKAGHANGEAQIVGNRLIGLAWLAWRAGDRPLAHRTAAEAAICPLVPADFVRLGALLARSGDASGAVRLIQRMEQDYGEFAIALRKMRLETMLVHGNREDAVREALAINLIDSPVHCSEYVAHAFWAAGRKDEARAWYRGIVQRPQLPWIEAEFAIPGVLSEATRRAPRNA